MDVGSGSSTTGTGTSMAGGTEDGIISPCPSSMSQLSSSNSSNGPSGKVLIKLDEQTEEEEMDEEGQKVIGRIQFWIFKLFYFQFNSSPNVSLENELHNIGEGGGIIFA